MGYVSVNDPPWLAIIFSLGAGRAPLASVIDMEPPRQALARALKVAIQVRAGVSFSAGIPVRAYLEEIAYGHDLQR